jgi:hypothetical protein
MVREHPTHPVRAARVWSPGEVPSGATNVALHRIIASAPKFQACLELR